jgi:thiamine kinase-like enzyme
LVKRTLTYLAPLRSAAMPLLFEHGDLGRPNLFLRGDGQMAVVDWERAESRGLPCHDFVFFLQYVSESVNRAFDQATEAEAFDDAFTSRSAWAHPWLADYASLKGIQQDLLAELVLASWARSSAGLLSRIAPAHAQQSKVDSDHPRARNNIAAVFAADKDFNLWRRAVDRFEELIR